LSIATAIFMNRRFIRDGKFAIVSGRLIELFKCVLPEWPRLTVIIKGRVRRIIKTYRMVIASSSSPFNVPLSIAGFSRINRLIVIRMERPKLNFIPKNEIKAYARKCHCRYYSRDVIEITHMTNVSMVRILCGIFSLRYGRHFY